MGIRWASLVADAKGEIEYARVRSLVSVVLGIIGGVTAIWVVFVDRELNEGLVYAMTGALVLPLTGGKIADALSGRSKAAAIIAGTSPGRRSTDVPKLDEPADDAPVAP